MKSNSEIRIVVCVKQVPDTVDVKIDSKTNNLVREGIPSILNPYDENAVEWALQLRDKVGGSVTVVTMGPNQAKEVLEYCMEMGADKGVILCDGAVRGSDTLATGYALSKLIESVGFDLILCGNEAIDGCTGQVGPVIAANLDIPQFTYVESLEFDGKLLKVCRDSGSYLEYYETKLPVVACVLKDTNRPRKRQQEAKSVSLVTASDIGLDLSKIGNDGSPTKVVTIQMSDARAKSYVMIDDSLPWEDRIKMIMNGGVISNVKVDLWRGSAKEVAKRLLNTKDFNRFLENVE